MGKFLVKARVVRILEGGVCPLGIKVGDEFDLSRNSPPLCHWAYNALYPLTCIFTYGGTEMIQYPMDIYPNFIRTFFTYILPAIFLLYYPALYILNWPDPLGMPPIAPFLAPFVAIVMLTIANLFWNYGLRFYESTGI